VIIASVTNIIIALSAVLLTVAAALTVGRMTRGPGSLDRVVAADVMIAIVIAAIALEGVWHHRSTALLVILVLSLLGFTGSVSIARLLARENQ
jgi:multicomponent Na+:H+ antiporter subunit F